MMWRKWLIIAAIFFAGMCGVLSVDQECELRTGEGGKAGLSINRTEDGNVGFCFFGLEGEINI